jgi:hypothetical protein
MVIYRLYQYKVIILQEQNIYLMFLFNLGDLILGNLMLILAYHKFRVLDILEKYIQEIC